MPICLEVDPNLQEFYRIITQEVVDNESAKMEYINKALGYVHAVQHFQSYKDVNYEEIEEVFFKLIPSHVLDEME